MENQQKIKGNLYQAQSLSRPEAILPVDWMS